jgi:hypothetical protein
VERSKIKDSAHDILKAFSDRRIAMMAWNLVL